MQGNNGKGNNILRDNWITPKWLFNTLNKQYNFEFDCCANYINKKTDLYSYDFQNINFKLDDLICWMNPPFSKAKKMFEHFFKVVEKGIAVYRCDNIETKIWQNFIFPNASWIFIPNKRIAYEGMKGNGSRFPSALIGYNVDIPNNIRGTILKVKNNR